ncbi:MAG: LacI family DNA-binding transcriptional regulator [Spirochaetota bacterium]
MKPITQKEIAKRAGVSQTAASMVLSGRKNAAISEGTKRKILSIAQKSGYRLRFVRKEQTRTNTIAYLLDARSFESEVTEAYYQRFIGSLADTLDGKGYALAVATHADAAKALRTVSERGYDAVITGRDLPEKSIAAMECPVIFLNRPSPDAQLYSSVMPDNKGGIAAAVKRLHEMGHRAIAFFGMTPLNAHSKERLAGYTNACSSLGLSAHTGYIVTPPRRDGTYEEVSSYAKDAVASWHASAIPPTAVVTMGDVYALLLLSHARAMGMRVPEDLSIVGFDNTIACLSSAPQLASIEQDIETMATSAAFMAEELIAGRPPRTVVIPTALMERGSIGPHASK